VKGRGTNLLLKAGACAGRADKQVRPDPASQSQPGRSSRTDRWRCEEAAHRMPRSAAAYDFDPTTQHSNGEQRVTPAVRLPGNPGESPGYCPGRRGRRQQSARLGTRGKAQVTAQAGGASTQPQAPGAAGA
jgi:hypothetical protein